MTTNGSNGSVSFFDNLLMPDLPAYAPPPRCITLRDWATLRFAIALADSESRAEIKRYEGYMVGADPDLQWALRLMIAEAGELQGRLDEANEFLRSIPRCER